MANIDSALEQQVLDMAQRQRVADIHHHYESDHRGEESNQKNRLVGLVIRQP